jgi:hypothetical protein
MQPPHPTPITHNLAAPRLFSPATHPPHSDPLTHSYLADDRAGTCRATTPTAACSSAWRGQVARKAAPTERLPQVGCRLMSAVAVCQRMRVLLYVCVSKAEPDCTLPTCCNPH